MVQESKNCGIKISFRRPRYLPGQYVEAIVCISNLDIERKLYVQNVSMEFTGLERIDLQWVKPYQDGRQPVLKDSRKQVFELFKCKQILLEEQLLSSGESIRCAIRFKLPSQLPPSFKGKSVRYSYFAFVTAKYATVLSEEQTSEAPELLVDQYVDISCKKQFQVQPKRQIPQLSNGVSAFQPASNAEEELPLISYESGGSMQQESSIQCTILTDAEGDGELGISNIHAPFTSMGGRIKLSVDQNQFQQVLAQNGNSIGLGMEGDEDEYSANGEGPQYLMAASSLGSQLSPGGDTIRDMGVISTRTYVLRLGEQQVMRCSMNPIASVMKPGSSISGVLDFRLTQAQSATENGKKAARVHQVVVSLETEESVQQSYVVGSRVAQGAGIRCQYEEQQFMVQDVQTVGFTISIPPNAPASFSTQIIYHKWLLRFELVAFEEGKRQPEITLWKLPILVHPL